MNMEVHSKHGSVAASLVGPGAQRGGTFGDPHSEGCWVHRLDRTECSFSTALQFYDGVSTLQLCSLFTTLLLRRRTLLMSLELLAPLLVLGVDVDVWVCCC